MKNILEASGLAIFTGLHLILYFLSPVRDVIDADVERWVYWFYRSRTGLKNWQNVSWLIFKRPEYRNLYYYRIRSKASFISRLALLFCKLFFAPLPTLLINCPEIGPGLVIQHGFATIISAKRMGSNCWVNQGVTIGYTDPVSSPMIGDDVKVTAGAKILGDVCVGDHCVIGANAVVVKNVPPNCTVVGVPAFIVRRDGQKVHEELN